MELDILTAVSPIDGRYRSKTEALANYFSEYALMKYRVRVEIEYFITLCELPLPQLEAFPHDLFPRLRSIYQEFSEKDAARVKDIESVTNHDVKAIEYFIKEQFDAIGGLESFKEFIHFGLTSQDINNTSFPLMLKDSLAEVYVPQVEELIAQLNAYAEEWKDIPMLAKTHGQPASPTRLGKEVKVFAYRLEQQLAVLKACTLTAKFGGATGNMNAHKVNPIDFENSEGNLGMANALLEHLSRKLPISRLQRDLTDSTVIRNIGVPMGHALISFQSTLKGLRKLLLNEEAISRDLDSCWAVVAEAIQTILRREAYPHPYEALKALTRTNAAITEESIHNFIASLEVSDAVKAELMAIAPHNYTGL